jgi:hypothetical protein
MKIVSVTGKCSGCGGATLGSDYYNPEPSDYPLYNANSTTLLCLKCRGTLELAWISKASKEELLLAVNYEWLTLETSHTKTSYPELADIKGIYLKRLQE